MALMSPSGPFAGEAPRSPTSPYRSSSGRILPAEANRSQAKAYKRGATGCALGVTASCLVSSTGQGWKPSRGGGARAQMSLSETTFTQTQERQAGRRSSPAATSRLETHKGNQDRPGADADHSRGIHGKSWSREPPTLGGNSSQIRPAAGVYPAH